jgi:hypothetical protein
MAAKCEWKQVDETTTTPTTPSEPTPLFKNEFCHPVTMPSTNAEDAIDKCIKNPKDNCNGDCMWSNGDDLIPKEDFCAPAAFTDDLKEVMKCINAKGETVCGPTCKWRRGKQPAANIPTDQA